MRIPCRSSRETEHVSARGRARDSRREICLILRATHKVTYLSGVCGKSQDRTRHPKSILDRAGYGRSASDDPSLAGPLEPQRVVGGGRILAEEGLHPPGNFGRRRFQVVEKGCGERLPRFVVAELLE